MVAICGLATSLASAQPVALTLSTGNTPLDRKVLEGVNQLLQARQSTALASAQPKPNKR